MHPTAGLVRINLRINPKARIVSNIPLSHHTWCSTAGSSVPLHGDTALRCWLGSILPALVLCWECLGPLPEAARRRTAPAPGSRQRQHSSCSQENSSCSGEQHRAVPVACTHPEHSFKGQECGCCSLSWTLQFCRCRALLSLCLCQQQAAGAPRGTANNPRTESGGRPRGPGLVTAVSAQCGPGEPSSEEEEAARGLLTVAGLFLCALAPLRPGAPRAR